jgi:outer membrane receptor for ferrienterochelin and colicins
MFRCPPVLPRPAVRILPRRDIALACAALLALAAPAQAQEDSSAAKADASTAAKPAVPSLERVEIRGARASDTEARRQSTAAKIVVGREEIERMGDNNLGDIMKRLPGVTLGGAPGRGGDIRMRGLGSGYTQILLNGERAPNGFSIESLTPDQIERIEILRAPTAEYGARAIAGTINIVLREDVRQRLNQVQLGLNYESDHWQPSLSWSRADQIDALSYNLSANLAHQDTRSRTLTHTRTVQQDVATGAQTATLDQLDDVLTQYQSDRLHLGGRLQWRPAAGHTVALMPFVMLSQHHSEGPQLRTRTLGNDGSAADYARADTSGDADYAMARLQASWLARLSGGNKMDWRLGGYRSHYVGDSLRQEFDSAGSFLRQETEHPDTLDTGWSASGKLTRLILGDADDSHEAMIGWEIETNHRNDSRSSLQRNADGSTTALSTSFGDDLQAEVQRTALWAQDEWNLNPQWAIQGGLRWEGIRTRSTSTALQVENRSSVTTPLFHVVWRPEQRSKDQLRLSLTRSYRAPSLNNLTARRSISSRYPVGSDGLSGNLPTSPDHVGNPELRPELATGIDLAAEHYFSGGGMASVSLFHRRISNLMRAVVSQQAVSWAGVPRWVSRPENIGTAHTSGIELEGKFRLTELMAQAAPLDLRANLSLFHSRVDTVPGPDNRLDQQPDWTANLGADYKLRSLPLTLGGGLNLNSDYAVQQSDMLRSELGGKRVLDLYALWSFSPATQLRISANQVTPRDYQSGVQTTSLSSDGATRNITTATSTYPAYTVWGLRLEMKL